MKIPLDIPGVGKYDITAFENGDYITDCLLQFGNWEPNVTEKVVSILRSASVKGINGCFMDLGAYVGYYSTIAAKLNVPCIAFEPNLQAVEKLEENRKNLGGDLITIKTFALGASPSSGRLSIDQVNKGGSFIQSSDEGIQIEIQTLDQQEINLPVLLLKIDVEGYEGEVIAGAKELLTHNKPDFLLVEVSPKFIDIKKLTAEIFQPLWEAGFSGFDIGLQDSGSFDKVERCFASFSSSTSLEKYLSNIGQTNFMFVNNDSGNENGPRTQWRQELVSLWKDEYIQRLERDITEFKSNQVETGMLISNLKEDNRMLFVRLNDACHKLAEAELQNREME